MPDPNPPVAEMKRLLFARIAELRELEGRYRETLLPPTMTYAHARYDVCRIAQRTFRASLDAHEAFLKQGTGHNYGRGVGQWYEGDACRHCGIPYNDSGECPQHPNIPTIQALYEALCGGEK